MNIMIIIGDLAVCLMARSDRYNRDYTLGQLIRLFNILSVEPEIKVRSGFDFTALSSTKVFFKNRADRGDPRGR
jgi:hypothetical protein